VLSGEAVSNNDVITIYNGTDRNLIVQKIVANEFKKQVSVNKISACVIINKQCEFIYTGVLNSKSSSSSVTEIVGANMLSDKSITGLTKENK
jgi:hypothetical protein